MKSIGLRVRKSCWKCNLYHLLAVWSGQLIQLNFLIHKMEIKMVPALSGCCTNWDNVPEALAKYLRYGKNSVNDHLLYYQYPLHFFAKKKKSVFLLIFQLSFVCSVWTYLRVQMEEPVSCAGYVQMTDVPVYMQVVESCQCLVEEEQSSFSCLFHRVALCCYWFAIP
jgi:hypothetical protein